MGFVSALVRTVLDMTVVSLIFLYLPVFPPYNTYSEFRLEPSPPWQGNLERNERLNLIDKLFENQIKGPESFAVHDGTIFTGLMAGVIARIDPDDLTITPVAKIGGDCDGQHEEEKCGRPLGLTFTHSGKLVVCDAVYGLYLIDLDSKESDPGGIKPYKSFEKVSYEKLVDPSTIINGSQNLVINAAVVAGDDEIIYFTVSSTNFHLRDSLFELISDPSGRLMSLNLKTREIQVLVEGINFANGLELSPEQDYLLICESGRSRILKYFLKGEKKGQHEIFIDALPGLPDNIKTNDRGNYYVGMISPRLPNTFHLLDLVGPHPYLRKFVCRLIHLVLIPTKMVNKMFPISVLQKFEYWCGNLEPLAHLAPPYGLVIEIDGANGDIVSSLHSSNGAVRFISEVLVFDRWIYLGSPYTNYLARIPKRLRDTSPRKSSAGVVLGMEDDSKPTNDPASDNIKYEL